MSSLAATETLAFGSLLKAWRARRRVSQLGLALDAELSQRHLSFLESGRSKPSRAAIEKLADALTVPRGERDRLFAAAGFVSPSQMTPWSNEARAAIDESLAFIIERHDPFPAMVVDRLWNLKQFNAATSRFLAPFGPAPSQNVVVALLHPDGPRRALVNWREAAAGLVALIEVEVARRLDDGEGRALLLEIFDLPGRRRLRQRARQSRRAGDRPALPHRRPRPEAVLDGRHGGYERRSGTGGSQAGNPAAGRRRDAGVVHGRSHGRRVYITN